MHVAQFVAGAQTEVTLMVVVTVAVEGCIPNIQSGSIKAKYMIMRMTSPFKKGSQISLRKTLSAERKHPSLLQ